MKKFKIIFIVMVSLIVLSELYLRIFNFETLKKFKRDLAYIPDSLYGYRYEPNSVQEFIWPDINKKFRFNNHGFYGPDFSEMKPPGYYRIIFVGNSVTLGIRTDGNDNFVMKLQDLFNENGYNIEIINCSVDGGTRDIGNMNIAKYEAIKYNPDLIMFEYNLPLIKRNKVRDVYRDILIWYNFSDKDSLQNLYSEIDKVYDSKFLTNLYDASYIVRGLCRWVSNNTESKFAKFFFANIITHSNLNIYIKKEKDWKRTENEYFTIDESLKMYSDLERYFESLNIKFGKYTMWGRKKSYNRLEFKLGIHLTEELKLPNEEHPNDKAHELIAKEMFNLLINSSLPLNNYKKSQ